MLLLQRPSTPYKLTSSRELKSSAQQENSRDQLWNMNVTLLLASGDSVCNRVFLPRTRRSRLERLKDDPGVDTAWRPNDKDIFWMSTIHFCGFNRGLKIRWLCEASRSGNVLSTASDVFNTGNK